MIRIFLLTALLASGLVLRAQNVLSLTADTIKISGTRDSGELVVRNHTRNIPGVLFNKGNGNTEFRALKFIRTGDSTLLILGQDTMSVGAGSGGGGTVYYGDPDILISAAAGDATHMLLHWWKTNTDLYESAKIGVIGDSQGKGDYASSYPYSIIGRLQNFIYGAANNPALTNYCQNGYNSRRLLPNGSNPYVDNQHNISKALADGNKIIVLCNTSNDFYSTAAGGVTSIAESMANTLQIADACEKVGANLFVVSSFPRNQLDPSQWDSLSVMAGLLNQKFGSRCAYVYHLIEDPNNPKQLNPALQVGDNTHLNDAGCNIVYSAIRDMLTSYFISNTSVAKYELQKAGTYTGNFSFYQYFTQPNNPNATLPADSNYYRLRIAYNNGYFSKWSNIVQGTLAHQDSIYNKPPLLVVNKPQLIFLPVNSADLTASASDPNTNGTITSYNWFKVMGNVATIVNSNLASTTVSGLVEGSYVFRCQVTDNNGLSTFADATVTVVVPDSNNTAAKFNFNLAPQTVSGWVDVSGGPLSPDNNGRTWTDNLHNNISVVNLSNSSTVWGPEFYSNAGNSNGQPTPDAGGYIIPQSVIASAWYSNGVVYNNASSDQMKISGLNPAKIYKLKFYSSLNTAVNLNANPTVVVVNDNLLNQKQVNAVGNTSNVIIFRGIVPNSNGEVPFFVGASQGVSQFGMLNGLAVQEDVLVGSPIPPSVTSGGNKTLQLPVNTASLSASAVDADGALISVQWTQVSGPAGATIANSSVLITSVANLSAGTYVFRCTVTDNNGATGSADVQVVVSPASTDPMLYVGESVNSYTASGWTVLAGSPGQNVISTTATLGSNTVTITTANAANYTPYLGQYTAASTGETIDDGGGFIQPLAVQQGNFFNENTYDPVKPQIQLTGLAPGTYKVTLFGSLQASYVNSHGMDATTEFRVNGGSPISVNTSGNTSHAAIFPGITVDSSGTMNLFFNPTVGGSDTHLGLLCFFILDKTN